MVFPSATIPSAQRELKAIASSVPLNVRPNGLMSSSITNEMTAGALSAINGYLSCIIGRQTVLAAQKTLQTAPTGMSWQLANKESRHVYAESLASQM